MEITSVHVITAIIIILSIFAALITIHYKNPITKKITKDNHSLINLHSIHLLKKHLYERIYYREKYLKNPLSESKTIVFKQEIAILKKYHDTVCKYLKQDRTISSKDIFDISDKMAKNTWRITSK